MCEIVFFYGKDEPPTSVGGTKFEQNNRETRIFESTKRFRDWDDLWTKVGKLWSIELVFGAINNRDESAEHVLTYRNLARDYTLLKES